jgi:hypothetical protein
VTVATADPHTLAVISRLASADLLTGRAAKPAGGGWQGEPGSSDFERYVVVYPSSGMPEPTLGDPHRFFLWQGQLTCVGATAQQAEQCHDTARAALLSGPLLVSGRQAHLAYQTLALLVQRDDSLSVPEWYVVALYEFRSSPA